MGGCRVPPRNRCTCSDRALRRPSRGPARNAGCLPRSRHGVDMGAVRAFRLQHAGGLVPERVALLAPGLAGGVDRIGPAMRVERQVGIPACPPAETRWRRQAPSAGHASSTTTHPPRAGRPGPGLRLSRAIRPTSMMQPSRCSSDTTSSAPGSRNGGVPASSPCCCRARQSVMLLRFLSTRSAFGCRDVRRIRCGRSGCRRTRFRRRARRPPVSARGLRRDWR